VIIYKKIRRGYVMKKIRKTLAIILVLVVVSSSTFAIGLQPSPENEYEFMDYIIGFVLENFKADISEGPVTRESLIEGAYRGIFESLDEHSVYFDEDEYKDFTESSDGEFGGIGISVTKEGKYIEVISPIKDTPGDKANIKSGDKIIKVDGEDITNWDLHDAVDIMRGDPGTTVTLTINRNENIFDVEITREIIEIITVESEVLESNIGYIQIKQFSDDSADDTKEALFSLKTKNIDSLIIDLRNNPGGYLDEVVEIADLLIDAGDDIVHVDYQSQEDRRYFSKNPDLFEKDIIVLVNEGSASASEILTGAIKDNNEGKIVGTTTYGKGTVQTLIPLATGGGMKVTVAEYMTANKSHINGKGIAPDIEVLSQVLHSNEELKNTFVPMNEKRDVKYGERSLNVYGMQQRLNYLGDNLTLDGSFGPKTLSAINNYQRTNDLPETRVITRSLVDHINESVKNYNISIEDLQLKKAIELLKK
jgi:carboxyl-terminal processing protease